MIKTSGSDKAHGCDKMSKKMIRVCSESPTVSLKVIFEQWLTLRKKFAYSYLSIFIRMREYTDQKNSEYRSLSRRVRKEGKFLEIWKKANVVPVHIREDKNLLKNYCPISLLPNIFERVIYNSLFNHFQSSKLFYFFTIKVFTWCFIYCPTTVNYTWISYTIQLIMWEVCFLTSLKPLIRSDIAFFYSSDKPMGMKLNYLPYLKIILIIVKKSWSNVWLDKSKLWSTTRVSIRTSSIFNFRAWSSWWNNINM